MRLANDQGLAAPAGRSPGPSGRLAEWAAASAQRLLSDLPTLWERTVAVVGHAGVVATGMAASDRELLIAAAYLQLIGYAPEVTTTGFRRLDAARYLQEMGLIQLAGVVSHSAAAVTENRWLHDELVRFPPPAAAVADGLVYSNVMSEVSGRQAAPGIRCVTIELRDHSATSSGARIAARPDSYAAVTRALRRVADAQPSRTALVVTPLTLGCSTLIRLHGALDECTADRAVPILSALLVSGSHSAVCDLAQLRQLDLDGARSLAVVAGVADGRADFVLLDPRADHRDLLLDVGIGQYLRTSIGRPAVFPERCV